MRIIMAKYLLIVPFVLLSWIPAKTQEIITELGVNPSLKEVALQQGSQLVEKRGVVSAESLWLPFKDDFSSQEMFPSDLRWLDNYAYVNSRYPVFPPTRGVATLDAINEFGEIYPHATPGPQRFEADFLTSRPIRLDSVIDPVQRPLLVSDSVYFSFFYQPQGYGNAPDKGDSLVLEFGTLTGDTVFAYVDSIDVIVDKDYFPGDTILLPCQLPNDSVWVSVDPYLTLHNGQMMLLEGEETTLPCDSIYEPESDWHWVWSTIGTDLDTTFYNPELPYSYFKQVLIPITDSVRYYKSDFQFRFRNYASLANNTLPSWQSNMDHWHIDYVYLNYDRSVKDTVYKELTFVNEPGSMIESYYSMPYQQYVNDPTSAMKDSVDILISNLDTISHNSTYTYYLKQSNNQIIDSCPRGNWDIPPVYTDGFLDYIDYARPPVCFGFYPIDFTKDSAEFIIDHVLTSAPGSSENLGDTVSFNQVFHNYFAYDDGSPEAGYGLTPEGSQLACKFTLNKADSLRALQIYFNETLNGANQNYFYIAVWNNNAGIPGTLIYSQSGETPLYTKELNKFHTYHLDSAIAVSGTFFVGVIQTTNDNLNIGFDRNNPSPTKIYYNTSGEWLQSIQEGSVMLRPVVGKPLIEEPEDPPLKVLTTIKVYPNPTSNGDVEIQLPSDINDPDDIKELSMKVFSMMGQLVYAGEYRAKLNISDLSDGLYVIRLKSISKNRYYTGKLIITR